MYVYRGKDRVPAAEDEARGGVDVPATPSLLTWTSSSRWMMCRAAAQTLDGNSACDVCM